jgi:AcrR family transcriptional regulator
MILQVLNSHSMTAAAALLKPRKSPVQARSAATIEALHTAAIQVLTREGLGRCTTTRVAKRAGMSVGSLYQYYPNRDALLAAVLEEHLVGIASAIDRACREQRGRPVSEMASALVCAFLAAKLRDPEKSRALYAVAGERGGPELIAVTQTRMMAAIAAMLATAPDARFDDLPVTSAIAFSVLVGPVRAFLEGHVPAGFEAHLEGQLVRLLTAYLQTHRVEPRHGQTAEPPNGLLAMPDPKAKSLNRR